MPLGGDIYRGWSGPNMAQAMNQGVNMRALADERQLRADERGKQQAIKNAYQMGLVTGEDGKLTQNRSRTIKELANIDPMVAIQQQEKWQVQDAQAQKAAQQQQIDQFKMAMQKSDFASRVLGSVEDQKSYDLAKSQLESQGMLKPGELPPVYDPSVTKSYLYRALTAKERLDNEARNRGLDLQSRGLDIKEQESRARAAELYAKANPTVQQKIEKLGGEARKRLDNIMMGNEAISDMANALAGGSTTFSMVGDNPFTFAQSRWEEAIGRMQSGGAINDTEAKRFRKLMPGPTDRKEIQVLKLTKMQSEMERRLSTFGINPKEMPGFIQTEDIKKSIADYSKKMGDGVNEAVADQMPRQVRQNGVVYTYNPKTGKYE